MKSIFTRIKTVLTQDLADRWEAMVSNFFFDLLSALLLNVLLLVTFMASSLLSWVVFHQLDNIVESWMTQHAIMLLGVSDCVFIVLKRVFSGWKELKDDTPAEPKEEAKPVEVVARLAIETVVESDHPRIAIRKVSRVRSKIVKR